MKSYLLCLLITSRLIGFGQVPDSVYNSNIKTPQLFLYGNQLEAPIIRLNGGDRLELHFDDLDGDVKNYYYTYQLCNADWTPANISQFDYIRGFSESRISSYRFSSIALTRYTHYQAIVPDVNCSPSLSGNYILKVFLDADTSKLVFTRRFLVTEVGASIRALFTQPSDPQISYTHQKIQFTVNTTSLPLSNPFQQIKVVILQNNRWDNATYILKPTFFNGNTFQYNSDDDCAFPAGKQWRWVDLQSFRYQSDRIQHADYLKTSTSIFMKTDQDRSGQGYLFFNDINGLYYIQTTESINPLWQTDYATVHFSFVPYRNTAFPDKDVYLLGKLTDYAQTDSIRMNFNVEKGIYETAVLLKQGYYNYMYITVDRNDPTHKPSFEFTEGNSMETENDYMILVYYRQLGGRADQLVGIAKMNTLNGKPSN
jgi:Domain of unknown function (DUF5103)